MKNNINQNKNLHPYYITGFSDGESCFGVKIFKSTFKIGWQVQAFFEIYLHKKDLPLLIKSFFGVGSITINEKRGSAGYVVVSLAELTNIIIPYFVTNENPLLPSLKNVPILNYSKWL